MGEHSRDKRDYIKVGPLPRVEGEHQGSRNKVQWLDAQGKVDNRLLSMLADEALRDYQEGRTYPIEELWDDMDEWLDGEGD